MLPRREATPWRVSGMFIAFVGGVKSVASSEFGRGEEAERRKIQGYLGGH